LKTTPSTRRAFFRRTALGGLGVGVLAAGGAVPSRAAAAESAAKPIAGFEKAPVDPEASRGWKPISDRRIRVGIAGYGVCRFGAAFSFQDHPNVEVVAVTDLVPERCEGLAKACRCSKTYPSLEEMVKDDRVEAVFVATDAPSHARHAILALEHGKHVASAVPAVFGSIEDAEKLLAAVKKSGLTYMMFETSCYHEDLHAMREIHRAGGLGKFVYAEGEYYHYMEEPIDSFQGWRVGLPPQWYPTHSNAYALGVTGGSFTEVSCLGFPSAIRHLQPANNRYQNPFGTEIALFRLDNGGSARMAVSWDTPGDEGERGRVRGTRGAFHNRYQGLETKLPETRRPPLPPTVEAGGHGGSHGHLTHEFITAVLQNRRPLVDVALALNMTVGGIVAHQSALRNGEWLKIPQFRL